MMHMPAGKELRIRRLFPRGSALVFDCTNSKLEPLHVIRTLIRSEVDAVILRPATLELVAEELEGISVILQLDDGSGTGMLLLTVRAAVELGADAVMASLRWEIEQQHRKFRHVTTYARSLGVPVVIDLVSENWLEYARLIAEFGADVLLTRITDTREQPADFRELQRLTGKPVLAFVPEDPDRTATELVDLMYSVLQWGVQGIVLPSELLERPEASSLLASAQALIHQGIEKEQALKMVRPPSPEELEGLEEE